LVRIILAAAHGYAGLAEEGFRQLELATRLSPRDYAQAGSPFDRRDVPPDRNRYDDAVVAERRAVQLRPDFGPAWRTLTAAAGLANDTPASFGC
jgi:adenylate cyclase